MFTCHSTGFFLIIFFIKINLNAIPSLLVVDIVIRFQSGKILHLIGVRNINIGNDFDYILNKTLYLSIPYI